MFLAPRLAIVAEISKKVLRARLKVLKIPYKTIENATDRAFPYMSLIEFPPRPVLEQAVNKCFQIMSTCLNKPVHSLRDLTNLSEDVTVELKKRGDRFLRAIAMAIQNQTLLDIQKFYTKVRACQDLLAFYAVNLETELILDFVKTKSQSTETGVDFILGEHFTCLVDLAQNESTENVIRYMKSPDPLRFYRRLKREPVSSINTEALGEPQPNAVHLALVESRQRNIHLTQEEVLATVLKNFVSLKTQGGWREACFITDTKHL